MIIIERSFKTIRTKSISAHDLLLAYESLLNASRRAHKSNSDDKPTCVRF